MPKFTRTNNIQVKKIIFILIAFAFVATSNAQTKTKEEKRNERNEKIKKLIKQEEDGAIVFNKQNVFGIKIYTDGYAAFFEKMKFKSVNKSNWYSLEIGERKHPKEEKLTKGVLGFAIGNPYIFGKINNFYFAKLGFGQQKLIGGKGNKNGVAVSLNYGGGLSAGFLKPYYLEIQDPSTNKRVKVKYNNNDSVFLNGNVILGSASLGKGFSEMKFTPGAFGKIAVRFDYGRFNDLVSAIEIGLNAEYYSQKMPIMLQNTEKQFFYNAFIAIEFGKRK